MSKLGVSLCCEVGAEYMRIKVVALGTTTLTEIARRGRTLLGPGGQRVIGVLIPDLKCDAVIWPKARDGREKIKRFLR